eukprot:gene41617-65732_t
MWRRSPANTDCRFRLVTFPPVVGQLLSSRREVRQNVAMVRAIPDPEGIRTARTLPAAWYADPSHHAVELDRVFRSGWVCAGVTE